MTADIVHLRLNARGQLTLPPELRAQLDLAPGDEVAVRVLDGNRAEVAARPVSLASLDGGLRVKRSMRLEDILRTWSTPSLRAPSADDQPRYQRPGPVPPG